VNEDGIMRICEAFDLGYGRVRAPFMGTTSANISVSCPLAIKAHGDPHDENKSCSIEVVDGGPSRVRCFSGNCRFKGKFAVLVKLAVQMRGSPPELVALSDEIYKLESVTLAGQIQRVQQQVKNAHGPQQSNQWVPPSRDRDVLPERFFEPFAGTIPQYAIDRGITVETAKAWGLGYDESGGYLVFPVRRRDQALVGLVGRAVSSHAKRPHHNYMGLDKTKHLFGSHMFETGKPLVIVESCIDTLNTWQALEGEANVGATLGEGFSTDHAHTIGIVRPPFTYVFTDGDPAGRLMAAKIVYCLQQRNTPTRIMECPWGPIVGKSPNGLPIRAKVDPSILPYENIRKLFREAKLVSGRIEWTSPTPVYDPSQPVE